jgi:COX assembly mitochondrial protein 2
MQYLTKDCGPIIQMFEECHDEHPIAKFMGACNNLKRELTLCLRAEVLLRLYLSSYKVQRKMRQRINNEIAMEKRKRIEAKWKEIEENS